MALTTEINQLIFQDKIDLLMSRLSSDCFRLFSCWEFNIKYSNSAYLFEMIYYEQAAAFGLSSVVYVPKIELDTVTELSAFCEKASMVNCHHRATSEIYTAITI